jgi:hypothetical protein
MASPVVTFIGAGSGGIKVITAETLTAAWTGATLALNTDTFIENANSLSEKVSATTITAYTVNTTDVIGEPFSFASGGGYDGNHIFAWIQALGTADTQANGGLGIVIADDLATDSVGTWYVGPQPGYLGGWVSYVINPSAAFDAVTAGTGAWTLSGNPAQLSGVDGFGVRWKITSSIMGASDNAMVDAISVGTGYRLTNGDAGSTEGKFSDFGTFEATTANRYGALRTVSGILLPRCKLRIGVSSGATNTEFIDSGFTVIWEKALLTDGASSAVASDFYALHVEKGSGTTDITLSNGLLACVSPHEVYLDFVGATSFSITNLNVQRARLIDLDGIVNWSGGSIIESGMMDLGGSPTLTKLNFLNGTDTNMMNVDALTELDNVSSCVFTNCGRAIKLNVSGTYTFNGLTFSSNTYDIENATTWTTYASYSESNRDADSTLNSGGTVGAGQSFTGTGGVLSGIRLYLKKTGSPTGNAVVKVYAHSGTFGTSSVPTGSAIATSDNLDVSSLTTTQRLVPFNFSGTQNMTLTNGTNYVLTLEYSGGNGSNNIQVGYDGSSPGHGGNYSTYNGTTWTADNAKDACFYVFSGAVVIVNATNGASPGTYINSTGTFDTTSCYSFNANTSTYTDETTDINNATVNDVALPPIQNTTAGDIIYFGNNFKFTGVTVNVGTAGVHSGVTINWEYWNGSAWTALTVIGSSTDFKLTGTKTINFTAPSAWATTEVNSVNRFWIRARDSRSAPSFTTNPLGTQGFMANTTINNAVTLTVTVKNQSGSAIQNAQVAIYKTSDDSQLMNEDTNASGIATESFNYTADTDVYLRVRKSSTGDTKYIPISATGTITTAGYSATVTLSLDTAA